MSKKRKHIKRWVAGIFAVAGVILLAVNALLLWVMSGPRDIGFVTPYIESALIPEGSEYSVSAERTILFWNSWQQPLGVKVTQVRINAPDHTTLATFPEIYLKLSIPRLLVGIVQPTSLEVSNPSISFYQREDGTLTFGLGERQATEPDANASPFTLEKVLNVMETEAGSGFRRLVVHNAKLKLGSKKLGVFLESPGTDIEIRRIKGGFGGNVVVDLMYEEKPSRVDVDFHIDTSNKLIQLDTVFSDIEPSMISKLIPDNEYVKQWTLLVNGWATSLLDYNGKVQSVELGLDAGPGTFNLPGEFDNPLDINRIQLGVIFKDDFNSIEIKEAMLDFGDPVLHMEAKLRKDEKGWSATGKAGGERMEIDKLDKYWPKKLAPLTRKWVTKNIRGGTVPEASAEFNFAPGDFDLPYTPDAAVKAQIKVDNSTVHFLPGLPKVTAVSGVVNFTGNTMEAVLNKGKFLNATVANAARVRCSDLAAGDTRMTADLDISAPATDVQTFLAFPQLNHAKRLNLTPSIKGSVTGTAKLDFIAFRAGESTDEEEDKPGPINTDDFKYDITANLKNVTQARFMNKHDIGDATGVVKLNPSSVTYEGTAIVDGMALSVNAKSGMNKTDASEYTIKGTSTAARMSAMGMEIFKHMDGDIGLEATVHDTPTTSITDATLNLTSTTIAWKEYNFSKAKGVKATLEVKSMSEDGKPTVLDPLNVTGDGLKMSGRAVLSADGKSLQVLNAKQMVYGKNDATIDYESKPVGFALKIRGKSFDAEPFIKSDDKDSNFSTNQLRKVTADVNVNKLYLKPNQVLQNVVAKVACDEDCNNIDLKGDMPNGKGFTYRMTPEGGKRTLKVHSEDAGEFFRTFGIFSTIQGGELTVDGTFNDKEAGKPLTGLINISEYSLKDAPILTRILTVASLTGILDGLSGNGITFSRLKAPFTYTRDVITFHDAKTHGSSIGLTANGTVNLKTMTLDLSGTVVPAYGVNTLLGNIPVIGEIAGGRDSGLIAINYSVKGKTSDPDVMVNPLSALTPGFLRNIFNIFDKPAPKGYDEDVMKKLEEKQKKQQDKEDGEDKPAAKAEKSSNIVSSSSIRPKKSGLYGNGDSTAKTPEPVNEDIKLNDVPSPKDKPEAEDSMDETPKKSVKPEKTDKAEKAEVKKPKKEIIRSPEAVIDVKRIDLKPMDVEDKKE